MPQVLVPRRVFSGNRCILFGFLRDWLLEDSGIRELMPGRGGDAFRAGRKPDLNSSRRLRDRGLSVPRFNSRVTGTERVFGARMCPHTPVESTPGVPQTQALITASAVSSFPQNPLNPRHPLARAGQPLLPPQTEALKRVRAAPSAQSSREPAFPRPKPMSPPESSFRAIMPLPFA